MFLRLLLVTSLTWGFALPASGWIAEASADEPAKAAPEVIMYTTRTCGYCEQARAWFTTQQVVWDERDIESSNAAREEWQSLGGAGTPLILINGKRISGFSPAALSAELAKYQ